MYRLIIVDDEFEIRNGLSRYFPWESVGFEAAAVFENARGALDYIRRNPVDVVLTDIEMPGMSGIELARVIHEQRLPATPSLTEWCIISLSRQCTARSSRCSAPCAGNWTQSTARRSGMLPQRAIMKTWYSR